MGITKVVLLPVNCFHQYQELEEEVVKPIFKLHLKNKFWELKNPLLVNQDIL